MKRLWTHYLFLVLLIMTGLSTAYAADPYQAGRDYFVLPSPQPVETGDKIEVREFFWYGCPHCYALEAPLNAYIKKLPANARFVRTPGMAPSWVVHAQTYYTFESLGVTEKLHTPFFDAIHAKGRALNSEASIADFAAEHGVDKVLFRQAFNSFGVRTRLERARQQNIAFMVEGVPALAVDGRYMVSPGASGPQEAMKIVDFLIRKAAVERKK